MFGATAAAPIFGAASPAATGFGFGAAAKPAFGAAPAPAGGLFGAAPAPAAGGLFGAAPAPAAGGLFGAAPAPAFGAAPAAGGLFGAAPAPAAGGLFGAAPAPAAGLFGAAPAPAGGLFGAAPAPAAGGLFGAAPAPAGGLFGAAPAPAGGLFGAAPASLGLFGAAPGAGGLFGGAQQQQQLLAQQQQLLLAQQQPATRETALFEELPKAGRLVCQDGIVAVERQLAASRALRQRVELAGPPAGEAARALRVDVAAARAALARAEHEQRRGAHLGGELRDDAERLRRDGEELAARAAVSRHVSHPDALRVARELPAPLLWRQLRRMEGRLAAYAADVDDLAKLVTAKRAARARAAAAAGAAAAPPPASVSRVLQAQNLAFMRVASDVAARHGRVDDFRRVFRDGRPDPFAAADRAAQGRTRERNSQLQRLISRPFSTRFG